MERSRLHRAVDGLIAVDLVIAGLALMAMLLHVVADVVMREVHTPFSGTLEIVSFWYMVALVFLAIPVAQAQGHHIRVELFTAILPPRRQKLMDLIVLLACAALLVLFVWVSTEEALRQTRRLAAVEAGTGMIPVWPTRWLVPLSMATTGLICLLQAWDLAHSLLTGTEPAAKPEKALDV